MTSDQVEELSSQSNQYILPRNQAKSRKHALICYTTNNREGAIKEAKILEECMEVNVVIIVKIVFTIKPIYAFQKSTQLTQEFMIYSCRPYFS